MNPAHWIAIAVVSLSAVTTGVGQTPTGGMPAADAPPAAVVQAQSAARYLFEAARDQHWGEAASQLKALQTALRDVPIAVGPPDLRRSLRTRGRELERAVPERRRIRAMEAANAVTRLTADLAETFHTDLPPQFPLLEYYGRQLQVGLATHRPALIRRATADLRQAWDAVRPELERRGQADDVKQLTDIVVSLEGAKGPAEVGRLASAELSEVEHLEAAARH